MYVVFWSDLQHWVAWCHQQIKDLSMVAYIRHKIDSNHFSKLKSPEYSREIPKLVVVYALNMSVACS